MKHVEITTSNHVNIEYELAANSQRVIATIIDSLVIFGWLLFVSSIGFSLNRISNGSLVTVFLLIPFFTYSFFAEAFFRGRTIGKHVMGTKVIRLDGHNPGLGECAIRWAFRTLDIWGSAGAVALLLASSSDRAQRIGDSLAGTTVINLRPKNSYNIKDLLSIKDSSKYTPKYPGVVRYSDEDMLLLKNALDRVKKFPNDAHKSLIKELATTVKSDLNIEEKKEKDFTFLKTILQDYIVLTRS